MLIDDLSRGELKLSGFVAISLIAALNRVRARMGLPEIGIIRGRKPAVAGCASGLVAGDRVRVKDRYGMRSALDARGHNRGLRFEPEMTLHLGTRHEVERRIDRMIDEQTGRMLELSDTVALRGWAAAASV